MPNFLIRNAVLCVSLALSSTPAFADQECRVYLGIATTGLKFDEVSKIFSKDLRDWSDADLDRFATEFSRCKAKYSQEMSILGSPEVSSPDYVNRQTKVLRERRDQLKAGEMEMASLPAECQADIAALDSKKSTLVNEVPVLSNELDQLFAAGAQDEACQKLQTFTNKLEHIRTSMLTCRDDSRVKSSSQYPPTLFLSGAAAFGKMEQTFTKYAQSKGCD